MWDMCHFASENLWKLINRASALPIDARQNYIRCRNAEASLKPVDGDRDLCGRKCQFNMKAKLTVGTLELMTEVR